MNRLLQKVVIVTGAGQGLGEAYATALAEEAAKVVVADIDFDNAKKVAQGINRRGNIAMELKMDVADEKSVEEGVREIASHFGGIDVLVNNAAISDTTLPKRSFEEIKVEEWDQVMAVNVRGCWLTVKSVLPYMKSQRKGKIINITSGLSLKGGPGFLHYATSKAAIIGMTRTLAWELGEYGINVNVLAPGLTLTERTKRIYDQARLAAVASKRCLKREEYPEDIIGTIIYLSSNDSDFVTGQTLLVNGGDWFI